MSIEAFKINEPISKNDLRTVIPNNDNSKTNLNTKIGEKSFEKEAESPVFESTAYHLMKNLPEVLQDDIILQQLLHPKTSDKFDYESNPNVQKLTFKSQPNDEQIVKVEGNIITQKIIGNSTLSYDKNKTVVQSQWFNCVMDAKEPELTQAKDGVYIKHYNELSLNADAFNGNKTTLTKYQSSTMATPQVLSHNFTNVFLYRPKERIFNVDFSKNIIYPAPDSEKTYKK